MGRNHKLRGRVTCLLFFLCGSKVYGVRPRSSDHTMASLLAACHGPAAICGLEHCLPLSASVSNQLASLPPAIQIINLASPDS